MCRALVEPSVSRCGRCGAVIGRDQEQQVEATDPLDTDIVEQAAAQVGRALEPNQATVAVALAGASWFGPGPLLSIPAWWLARRELYAIREGRRSDKGRNIAAVAWWLAVMNIVAFTLGAAVLVFRSIPPLGPPLSAEQVSMQDWLDAAPCGDLTPMKVFEHLPAQAQQDARESSHLLVTQFLNEQAEQMRERRGCPPLKRSERLK